MSGAESVSDVARLSGMRLTGDLREWHEWRARHIGGSDISTVAGLNPWGSRWALWRLKRGEAKEDLDEPTAQRFRLAHDHEVTVAREFELLTGLYIAGEQTWCEHPEHPHHGATIDGFVTESLDSSIDDALGVAEIKTTGGLAPWHELPDHVLAQVQWQMHVTGLDHAWVPVMFGGQRVKVYEVERDEGDIAALVAVADRFWGDVVSGRPPLPDHRDLPALQARWPEAAPGEELALDKEAAALVRAIAHARAASRLAREHEDSLVAQLLESVGDAETLTENGAVVATYKSSTRGSIDAKRLRTELPEVAERFTRTTSYRSLRIKGGGE
jgi:putative phage-type endonuclease